MKRNALAPVLAVFTLLSACTAAALQPGESASSSASAAIDWSRALELLKTGEVAAVVQLHDLTVTLTTQGGAKFVTKEPAIDAIFAAIAMHAPNARSIIAATE